MEDAITLLEASAEKVQLLFSDVHMPPSERTGFDLARECAQRWPHIGILVASGQAKPGANDLPEGASFIGKPFSAQIVRERLQQILPDGKQPTPLKR